MTSPTSPNVCPGCDSPDPRVHKPNCTVFRSPATANATGQPNPTPPVAPLAESPYSWNVFAQDKDGWGEQFTVRSMDSKSFVHSVEGIKKYLVDHGYTPAPRGKGSAGTASAASAEGQGETVPECGYGHGPMTKRQKKDGSGYFWSCNTKLPNGEWCQYRPPKK